MFGKKKMLLEAGADELLKAQERPSSHKKTSIYHWDAVRKNLTAVNLYNHLTSCRSHLRRKLYGIFDDSK